MKKLLTLLLVVALVLSLFVIVSCGGKDNDTDTDTSANTGSSDSGNVSTDTGSQTPSETDEDLQAAYDYIKLTYKTLGTTSTSFELMKNAPIGDKVFAITWSTDNEAITITETEDGNFYLVNIPALGESAVNYKLKFSIQNEAGEKKEGEFSLTIPKFAVNTFDEYVAAEDGTPLIIQGIVTGVISKTTNSTKENSLFIQDLNGNGGYYAYNLAEDPNGTISVGMTVEVRGNKKNYNGTFELTSPVATVIDSTIKTVTPVDFTTVFAGAEGLDAVELTGKNGMLVTIKGVTLLEYVESNGYHYFQLGNHKSYLRVSSSSNCITKEDGEKLTADFQKNFYNSADVTGIVAVYNGDMYLMPVSVNAFTNIVELEKPADVKVDTALSNTKLPSMIQIAGNTDLPTTFSGFSDVTIAWELVSVAGVDCATINGNVLTVTIPTAAQTVKVKATATCGDVSDSKEFEIIVKPISTITILEANNIGMNMAHNTYTDELYYIVGVVDSIANSTYGNLYIVDGDYSLYIYGVYDATGEVRYDKMNPQPLPKDTIKVLSSVGKYSNDVQLKNAKVVEHTVHEDNINQEPETEVEFKPVNPIVGTEYYFGMVKNDSVYFITGSMGSGNAQYYMATTNNQEEAAVITVIAGPTADTYYITLTVGGATKYMDLVVSGTHKNAVYVDEAPEVGFSFDSEFKVFYKVLEENNYTFGTALSNNFTTVGGVKVDAENAMLQIAFADEHTCTFTDVVTDPTCTEDGYTTHTCPCGNVVVDTKVDALGHDFVSGVCSVCGATDHEHVYDSVVTDPTCTEAGYTTYTCNVPNCGHTYTEPGEAALGHSYTDGVCANGCGTDDPDYYYPISIADALKATVGKKVILTGTISEIKSAWSTQYSNMEAWLSDGTDSILLYRIKTQVGVGDKVTVKGEIGVYKEVNQIAQNGSTVTVDEKHTCSEFIEATCQEFAICVVCGAKSGTLAEHTYVEGVCSVCGHEEGTAEAVKFTASKTMAELITANGWTTTTTKQSFNLDDNVSVKVNGGNNTGKAYNNDHIRIYATDTPAGTLTISVVDGYELVSIKVTTQTGTYAFLCVDGNTADISNQSVDVSGSSVVLNSVKNGTDGKQVRVMAIEVVYKEA